MTREQVQKIDRWVVKLVPDGTNFTFAKHLRAALKDILCRAYEEGFHEATCSPFPRTGHGPRRVTAQHPGRDVGEEGGMGSRPGIREGGPGERKHGITGRSARRGYAPQPREESARR